MTQWNEWAKSGGLEFRNGAYYLSAQDRAQFRDQMLEEVVEEDNWLHRNSDEKGSFVKRFYLDIILVLLVVFACVGGLVYLIFLR